MENKQIQIPEGWEEKSINDLCIIGRGRVISQNEIFNKVGIYPVYSSQSQNNGEMGKINTYDFDGNYVTWTTDGAHAGTIFFRSGKFNCTNVCGTLKEKDEQPLDLVFLSYLLSTVAKDHVSYVGNPKLMNGTMSKIPLTLPKSKTEQKKIAEILSKVDTAIEQTQSLIAKYQRIKTGLMQDLLTKGIDENGNIRSEETHEFKDSELGRIPMEWDCVKLDKCKKRGTTITYGIVQTYEHIEDGIPVLRTIDLNENGINPINQLLRTKKSISNSYKRTILEANDIVCNVRASVGDFNLVSEDYANCNTTRGVARICPSKNINNGYLVWFLKSKINEHQMNLLIKGTTFIDINIADLRQINVLLPTQKEQDSIQIKLDKIQLIFRDYTVQLQKLQSIKTALMQDLLSGKKRVSNLIKENAL